MTSISPVCSAAVLIRADRLAEPLAGRRGDGDTGGERGLAKRSSVHGG